MDRLTSMDVFASIVANGSFAGAARQAQVSPTVVSKHVQALENWLGVKLLNRSTRRVALTEAGEAFYERCKRILSDVEDAAGMAGELQTTLRGRLRISAPGLFGVELVTPAAVAFMAEHPDVSIRLDINDRYVDILGEGYRDNAADDRVADSYWTAKQAADALVVEFDDGAAAGLNSRKIMPFAQV
jgi:DNA-binding transcriptional LysR family regulator